MRNLAYLACFFIAMAQLYASSSTTQLPQPAQTEDPLRTIMSKGILVGFDGTKPPHQLTPTSEGIKFTKDGVEYLINAIIAANFLKKLDKTKKTRMILSSKDKTHKIIIEIDPVAKTITDTDGEYLKRIENLQQIEYIRNQSGPEKQPNGDYKLRRKIDATTYTFTINEFEAARICDIKEARQTVSIFADDDGQQHVLTFIGMAIRGKGVIIKEQRVKNNNGAPKLA